MKKIIFGFLLWSWITYAFFKGKFDHQLKSIYRFISAKKDIPLIQSVLPEEKEKTSTKKESNKRRKVKRSTLKEVMPNPLERAKMQNTIKRIASMDNKPEKTRALHKAYKDIHGEAIPRSLLHYRIKQNRNIEHIICTKRIKYDVVPTGTTYE